MDLQTLNALSFFVGMLASKFMAALDVLTDLEAWKKIALLIISALIWALATTPNLVGNAITPLMLQQLLVTVVLTLLGTQTWYSLAIKLPEPWKSVVDAFTQWLRNKAPTVIQGEPLKGVSYRFSGSDNSTVASGTSAVNNVTYTGRNDGPRGDSQPEVDAGNE